MAVAPVGAGAELRADYLATPRPLTGLGDVTALAFSPDGRRLAAATDDERVVLYDLAARRVTAGVEAGERNDCVAFSPDGTLLASTCSFQAGAHVRLDRVTPDGGLEPVTEIEALDGDEIPAVVFTPDGRHLVIWTGRHDVLLMADTRGAVVWQRSVNATRIPPALSSRPCLTPDGETIALGLDGLLVLLATRDGRTLAVLPVDGGARSVAAGPGPLLVGTSSGLRTVTLS
ncbi:hypothetical protein [Actinoplanes sp. NPDC048796]|uniref:WD40 repeat domain-containing protein n=1 Tax=Actinoplanes sp. NPDC048796 TaxID=3155640 RepID=UPI00340E9DC6